MTKLEKYQPNNLSVLKLPDESILILLNFKTTQESTDFMQNIIEKHIFKLSISINDKKEFGLILTFPEREETFVFQTGKTVKDYSSFSYLQENRTAVLSCGTRAQDGKLEIYQPPKPLDGVHLN